MKISPCFIKRSLHTINNIGIPNHINVLKTARCQVIMGIETPHILKVWTEKGTPPLSILSFVRDGKRFHPTQKPVDLLEWLIKTYTNEGETVLDNCMSSGSTGVACVNTNRNFIGIELDETYFKIAEKRISV